MKKITLILFALLTCWQINAQVSSYAFAESTEAYAQITGTTSTATGDDGTQTNIPIGFNFNYGGVNYTAFGVSTNGIIRLGSNATDTAINTGWTNGLSNTAANRPLIAVLWDDNNLSTGTIIYSLTGTAPNQVLTVNWHNTKIGSSGGTGGASVSTLLRLYETTNVIEMVYSNPFTTANTVTASVGLNDVTSFLSVTPAATSTVSSATTNDAINATVMANLAGKKITFTPPSCAAPAGFVASALTATTATIAWNAASPVPSTGYEYYYSSINTAPSAAGTPTSNLTENLTGLSVNTPYYVWLRSDCGGGTFSAWAGPFTFSTTCNSITTLPHAESFDAATNPSCWSTGLVTGVTNWAPDDANDGVPAARTGARFAGKSWVGNDNALLISPVYNLAAYSTDQARLNVWIYRSVNGLVTDRITFYANTVNNLTGATMLVDVPLPITSAPVVTSAGWYNYTVDLPLSFNSVGNFYIIAQGRTSSSFTSYGIGFDDYVLELKPSCVEPNSIIASNITSTTVDLSWTDGSGGLQFDYEYAIQAPGTGVPASAGAQVGDVTIAGEGFDINGDPLAANTLYEVYVRSDCGGGDFSPWVGPITFRTLCSTFVAPFNQPFASNTFPSCWSQSGPTPWEFGSNVTTPAGFADYGADLAPDFNGAGGTFIGMDGSDNTNGEISVLLSPFIDVTPLTTPRLKYAVFGNNTNDAARNLLQVEVWNGTSWNLVNTVSDNLGTNWVVFTTNLSTLTITGPIQIRFTVTGVANGGSTFYHDILIDDVTVDETPSTAPSCASNIVATPNASCGNFSNTISWNATSGANGYYLTIGTTSGGTDVLNNSDLGSTVSYSFTGTIGTTYFYTLVPYNAIGSATGCTEQSFTTNANGCYCVSAPTSVDGTGITNVQLVTTNFANTVAAAPVYNDHTATVVDMTQGINNNVQISFNTGFGYDYNIVIWIDANNDYVLNASEIVYTGLVPNTPIITHNASFVMPATIPLGQHRMRIIATDALQNPANPCYSGTFGETADFTINIVAASCTPPSAQATIVPVCGTAQFTVDVNVTALGSGTPSISDGTTTWPVSAIGVVNVGPFASGSSVTLTLLHGSDATCNLPLGSLSYSCPPANDDCANAISVLNMPYNNSQNASAATGAVVSTCTGMNDGVWYTVVGNGSDIIIDVTAVTGWDPELGVYTGSCGNFTCVASIDDGGTSAGETYTIVASTLGTTYYINVGHYNGFADSPEGPFTIDVTTTLSSDSFNNANFTAYPNPVKDVLNISYTSEISSVRVINMIGQEVLSKNINATSSQVDMSQLSAGTYIVNVTVGDAIKTLKVVKQ
ncbi:GEVED domain-containing protein [Flavobacterium sp.]|jgi:hypothetical protein|uniref:GEVED domain-containing protein n=1 Tax=Flavobacterium sp. TaxID=239 RepID=UPI0037C153DC